MATYLAPGVYVEAVPAAVKPIAGVGTSTAGIVGIYPDKTLNPEAILGAGEQARAGEPQLITSWDAFERKFGGFTALKEASAGAETAPSTRPDGLLLAHAVYGFFDNGGARCWVTRITADSELTSALAKFEAIDEIALVLAPGMTDKGGQKAVIDHCEKMADRFAILDGKEDAGDNLTKAAISNAGATDDAALYFPWIMVADPISNSTLAVPPSGHVAGIYARVDQRRGVFKAPANETIRGALGVKVRLSRSDQAGLNPAGINVIRELNSGITVWGARTLSSDPEWTYVNVRRFFSFLRESIDEGTGWVVFESNTPELWGKIRRNITAFLRLQWEAGAFFGAKPEEAFYVRCDADTNPSEVRDLGQVVTEIGVAIVRPAEFVIFRVSQWAGPGQQS